MYTLKTTEAESIGKGWKALRAALLVTWFASIVVAYFAPIMALAVMGVSSAALSFVTGRVYVIQSLYRIRTATNLRERLMDLADHEFVLNDIRNDQLWRGEAVNPEIEAKLKELGDLRNRFQNEMVKAVMGLFDEMKPNAEDPKKPEPN